MRRLLKTIIRSSAFFRKEIVEVLRQPRLILALVLGPFLILLLFGIGYRNEARAVRTVFVANQQSGLIEQIQEYAPTISPQIIYEGITVDESEALAALRRGIVDLVIIAPKNAYDLIRSNQHAMFTLYHNEIDPAQAGYIQYLGQIIIDEVNRRVLSTIAAGGQQEAADFQESIRLARERAAAMKEALRAGNAAQARVAQQEVRANLSTISLAVGASVGLLSGVQENLGTGEQSTAEQEILNTLAEIQNNPAISQEFGDNQDGYDQEIREIEDIETRMAELDEKLAEFQSVSPEILVRPFTTETMSIAPVEFTPLDFFTPGVIVLLLQHVAVTIAALSIVREKTSGTLELFRVSPISAAETLLGKYLSYMVFGIMIAAILGALLAFGLRVPMLGRWEDFAIVVVAVLFASLGLGFLISLTAQTESQAVQFAMIALLLSVFFSGFLLDLRYLLDPVKAVSYALPATHGAILLQNIMLRGNPLLTANILALFGIALILVLIDWLIMRRRMANE